MLRMDQQVNIAIEVQPIVIPGYPSSMTVIFNQQTPKQQKFDMLLSNKHVYMHMIMPYPRMIVVDDDIIARPMNMLIHSRVSPDELLSTVLHKYMTSSRMAVNTAAVPADVLKNIVHSTYGDEKQTQPKELTVRKLFMINKQEAKDASDSTSSIEGPKAQVRK